MTERMQQLSGQGKLRTALDVLLPILARDPHNQEALWYANLIVGMHGRTTHLQAAEPLSNRYLFDTRLDSLYATCSRCHRSWMPGSTEVKQLYQKVSVTNAMGRQCTNCGYVVCRECASVEHLALDLSLVSAQCSNCKKEALSPTVYPTGRLPLQLPRRPTPVKTALVYRQGPIPPDKEYMTQLLDDRSPDALDDRAELIGCPVSDWPAHSGELLLAAISRLAVGSSDVESGELTDDSGQRVYLVKSFAVSQPQRRPDTEKAAPRPLEKFHATLDFDFYLMKLDEELTDSGNEIGALLVQHLKRLFNQHRDSRALGPALAEWRVLVEPGNLEWASEALAETMQAALRTGTAATRSRRASDLLLVATAVPALDPNIARRYFEHGYMAFLDTQGFPNPLSSAPRAHWVLCSDGSRALIHLTHLPRDTKAIATLAHDLMDDQEKRAFGMA
jgi:hypothetical protein